MAIRRAPLDESLPTLPHIADFYATYNHDAPWLMYPFKGLGDRPGTISYGEMARASHRVAHILRPGREGPEREVIAVILNTDTVLYAAVILGLMRAGFIPYPMSPRNSPQGVVHMLKATSCQRILLHASTASLVYQVQAEMASEGTTLRVDNLPGLYDVFPQFDPAKYSERTVLNVEPYPTNSAPIDMLSPALYLHSSGSTGHPKSIDFTYRRLQQWMGSSTSFYLPLFLAPHALPDVFGSSASVRYGAMGLPTFHGMGFLLQVTYPLAVGREVVVYPPQYPAPPVVARPENVYEAAKATECTALLALPSFAWSHSPEIISYLKTLTILVYGGGPLSFPVGNKLVTAGVPLCNGYGGTEFGNPMLAWDKIPRDEDWYYFHFAPDANVRFENQGDGTYELVVVQTERYHLAVHNIPGEKAYATSDLFKPHPTRPNLWTIVGRKDDVITLSTGEKIVPIPQESLISASALVGGCVMFGREREQPGILVEPRDGHAIDPTDHNALAGYRNRIWSVVEDANAAAPGFAKVFKEMILVTSPDKPLPRAGKGTVIRKQALAAYAEEIKEFLSATFFRNHILGALRASSLREAAQNVSSNIVFEHPTMRALARALHTMINPSGPSLSKDELLRTRVAEINTMIDKYKANLPTPIAPRTRRANAPLVVLLTGSTGNIGSHILASLLAEPRVSRVYALNRPSSDPMGRVRNALTERRLPVEMLDDTRFVSLAGDVTKQSFGLASAQYDELVGAVTHVVHNAWTVNFNLPLSAFEDQIAGVRKLVDISASSSHRMQLLITSSVGIANSWDPAQGPVPERPLPDPAVAADIGYSASKYVVEQLLDAARAKGVEATAIRMGQACGPRGTGAWGTSEWMPIMVKSSIAMGCLPAMTGPVAWVPLDAVGQAYVDWVCSEDDLPGLVNVVHPRPTDWATVLVGLQKELGDRVPLVPPAQWMDELELRSTRPSPEDVENIPALKLVDFFRAFMRGPDDQSDGGVLKLEFETTRLISSSQTMKELQSMSEEDAEMWVRYWEEILFIAHRHR
ncbi:hypothetical protein PHLGIDRAFT_508051 [Phlebiopsis gigantea 11061_1 CR5-6]|uniref:Polyketide synthase phosphopantetheine-binding domain-containing protein n=1 Tax=Phlebiopsis gigantea (strain 11061_1 CR5-6) TaxID=745531 RepID=A0A0C3SDW7_PHLG1|nr:hypothetical protein PHLGIDRAFT_508051 [Phlebiopsis gigantea 11061_1 CR5-6]